MAPKLLVYTRTPKESKIYSTKLAASMHLALDLGDGYKPLNNNYGVLFARASENEDGSINAKSLDKPFVFRKHQGGFGVVAISLRAEMDANHPDEERKGCVIVSSTPDLVHYTECGVIKLSESYIEDVACVPVAGGAYKMYFRDADGWHVNDGDPLYCFDGDGWQLPRGSVLELNGEIIPADAPFYESASPEIEGICPRNVIELTDAEADYLYKKLNVARNVSVDVPEKLTVGSREELHALRVTAHYSDGTTAKKRIDWYDEDVDFSVPGTYTVKGRVHQDRYEFPLTWHRADPCVGRWNGKYYFIATNDRDGNNSLSIRESDTIPGLFTAQETKILDTTMYPHMKGLLWAPEFHIIKDKLYIFHAATKDGFPNEQSHVMALKEGGNPMLPEDWEMSRRVVKADGSELFTLGITLDMTEFEIDGRYYVIWSQRRYNPFDFGAWLMLAEIDPDEPWRLITEPVAISKPDYGWANNHTFVDEGPYPLLTDKKIIVTYSAAMVDETYVVAMLSAEYGSDLHDPKSWTKINYPLMSSATVKGEFGTGHNAYVTDDEGDIWNIYHGRPGVNMPRSSGVRRVHFDIDGDPVLGLTEEKDLDPKLAAVSVEVTVE